jgi:hypothetical protein
VEVHTRRSAPSLTANAAGEAGQAGEAGEAGLTAKAPGLAPATIRFQSGQAAR